jgi:transposase
LKFEVVDALRNSLRRYDPASKQRLIEACLQPDESLASSAPQHGVDANLLRNRVAQHCDCKGMAWLRVRSSMRREVFVPVVKLCGVAGPPPIQHRVHAAKVARHMDPPGPRLTVEVLNGITLRLECSGHNVEPVPSRRALPNQRTAAKIGCNVLNNMTCLGMPLSVRIK